MVLYTESATVHLWLCRIALSIIYLRLYDILNRAAPYRNEGVYLLEGGSKFHEDNFTLACPNPGILSGNSETDLRTSRRAIELDTTSTAEI